MGGIAHRNVQSYTRSNASLPPHSPGSKLRRADAAARAEPPLGPRGGGAGARARPRRRSARGQRRARHSPRRRARRPRTRRPQRWTSARPTGSCGQGSRPEARRAPAPRGPRRTPAPGASPPAHMRSQALGMERSAPPPRTRSSSIEHRARIADGREETLSSRHFRIFYARASCNTEVGGLGSSMVQRGGECSRRNTSRIPGRAKLVRPLIARDWESSAGVDLLRSPRPSRRKCCSTRPPRRRGTKRPPVTRRLPHNLCFPAAPLHLERIQADLLGASPRTRVAAQAFREWWRAIIGSSIVVGSLGPLGGQQQRMQAPQWHVPTVSTRACSCRRPLPSWRRRRPLERSSPRRRARAIATSRRVRSTRSSTGAS